MEHHPGFYHFPGHDAVVGVVAIQDESVPGFEPEFYFNPNVEDFLKICESHNLKGLEALAMTREAVHNGAALVLFELSKRFEVASWTLPPPRRRLLRSKLATRSLTSTRKRGYIHV